MSQVVDLHDDKTCFLHVTAVTVFSEAIINMYMSPKTTTTK
nr:MAG TPA: hypothetical protein [Caudoviricetes sp.]